MLSHSSAERGKLLCAHFESQFDTWVQQQNLLHHLKFLKPVMVQYIFLTGNTNAGITLILSNDQPHNKNVFRVLQCIALTLQTQRHSNNSVSEELLRLMSEGLLGKSLRHTELTCQPALIPHTFLRFVCSCVLQSYTAKQGNDCLLSFSPCDRHHDHTHWEPGAQLTQLKTPHIWRSEVYFWKKNFEKIMENCSSLSLLNQQIKSDCREEMPVD